MDSFAITLNCHPKKCLNKGLQKFYTVFPEKIILEGDWEVGLSEISFTNNVYNIEYPEHIEIITPQKNIVLDEYVQPGLYTIDSLIEKINCIVKNYYDEVIKGINVRKNVLVSYEPKVTMGGVRYNAKRFKDIPDYTFKQIPHFRKLKDSWVLEAGIPSFRELYFLKPSKRLCELIGFVEKEIIVEALDKYERFNKEWTDEEKDNFIEIEKTIVQKYPHKMNEKYNSFLICSDIGQPIMYGENYQPILRYINFDNMGYKPKMHIQFKKPYFVKLRKNPFERIEIKLFKNLHYLSDVDALEFPYWMRYGEIRITLQFRKISNYPRQYETEIPKIFKTPRNTEFDVIKFKPDNPPPTRRLNP